MFKRSTDGAVVCRLCLPTADRQVSVELMPHLFPGTYQQLTCADCGNTPPDLEAIAPRPRGAGPAVLEDMVTPTSDPASGIPVPRSRSR